jgi:hypothetical protein
MVTLEASILRTSENVHFCGQSLYTPLALETQWGPFASKRTLFGHLSWSLRAMASIERTAYPRFKPSLTANELQTLYDPTEEERDFVSTHARGEALQLTLLTLLKCQQHLGYLPALADVPDDIRTYLCQQLHPPSPRMAQTPSSL